MTKEQLIKNLVKEGYLKNENLIDAFEKIDRKDFVLDEYKLQAYENYPLPIGFNQTISQPLVVAFMLELLQVNKGDKILEIGTGSGWQTALLAYLVSEKGKIISIERINELKNFAEKNLKKYDFLFDRIKLIVGDGALGYEPEKPFDKIICSASSLFVPIQWQKQLKIGGLIVAPIKNSIFVLEKISQKDFKKREYFGFVFVPLISN